MKKINLLLLFVFILIPMLNAQRYFGTTPIGANIALSKDNIGISVNYEKLFSYNKNSLYLEFLPSFERRNLNTQTYKANILNLNFNLGFNRYFEYKLNILPYIGLGVYGGYDFFLNKNKLPDSVIYERKFGFQYGIFGNVGLEYMFEKYGLNISYRPLYDLNNQNINSLILIGVKYYLN